MNNLATIPEERRSSSGFYPTPESLAVKMLAGIQWSYVDSVLEPSAGKGNLAEFARTRMKDRYSQREPDIDCIEIDPNLRAILKEKGLRVVHDDFMSYTTQKRYRLIIMNPPFEDGARHILKALNLLIAGGQLIALCNAETLRNAFTGERQMLMRQLNEMNADIEFLQNEFRTAERKTDVEIALIKVKAPKAEQYESLVLENLKPAHKYAQAFSGEATALTKDDFMEAILDRYSYEVEAGVNLIHEYWSIQSMIDQGIGEDKAFSGCSLTLDMGSSKATVNEYVRSVRKKYWSALFCAPQFMSQLTSNLQSQLQSRVTELADYEFSAYNILEIMIQMNAQVNDGVEKTIMDLFDKWTVKWHYDENSKNRHYFDGWKTNDAFAVNKKVICRLNAFDWGYRNIPQEFRVYKVWHEIEDIQKVFNYLDGGRTKWDEGVQDTLQRAEKEGQTAKIETKYFWFTFYKKGTCHIEFKDMNLLAKFNIFAAKNKKWLPPSFGRKKYAEMDPEEQKVAKSFMGSADRYDKVVQYAHYFLADPTQAQTLKIGG